MRRIALTPELLELVADRFRALAEPVRLRILSVLRAGELTVTELVEETGLGQANLSKHLQLLHALGFVTRRKEGLHVYYALTDDDVFELCDIMCGRLGAEARRQGRALGVGARARA
ncbi:MAG TPA: metalloregulator ArsR/SmtB family transcription factor [Gemmatimonadaceae bacterium]|nr:metalloregulator ArsR/SmtB family transcription factor [Gemmatimonadaceae bacterium]